MLNETVYFSFLFISLTHVRTKHETLSKKNSSLISVSTSFHAITRCSSVRPCFISSFKHSNDNTDSVIIESRLFTRTAWLRSLPQFPTTIRINTIRSFTDLTCWPTLLETTSQCSCQRVSNPVLCVRRREVRRVSRKSTSFSPLSNAHRSVAN